MRTSEIERALGYKGSGHLTPFVNAGILRKERDGRGTKYYVV